MAIGRKEWIRTGSTAKQRPGFFPDLASRPIRRRHRVETKTLNRPLVSELPAQAASATAVGTGVGRSTRGGGAGAVHGWPLRV